MTVYRTVFIDSNLNDVEAIESLYDSSVYTVVTVSGGYEAIQDYLAANAISASDINVISASSSQNGVFTPRVVFVDPGVANYQQLIADMPANATIVVLDATADGVQQIHDFLAANVGLIEAIDIVADIASLDVISHGGAGEITLGSTVLTSANLADYEAELAAIGGMLTENGDILIYGCDVAAGAEGQQFIEQLAAVTGADVAASTDLTGSESAGGDWVLEASTGMIETAAISDLAYGDVLANSSITAASATSITTDTGSSSTDFITRDTTITVAGSVTASAGSSPQSFYVWLVPQGGGTAMCLNPSQAIDSVAGSTTSWSLPYAPALAQGTYTIQLSLSNNISNFNNPASKLVGSERSLTIDTSTAAPIVALVNDTGPSNNDKVTNDGTLSVTGQEAGATISYSIDGGNTFTNSFTAAEGANTVIVRSTDVAGNTADTTFGFTLDSNVDVSTVAPTVALENDTGAFDDDEITSDGTLSVTGQEEGATLTYSRNGGEFVSSFTAVEGENIVIVRSTDVAGNSEETEFTFTLDTGTVAPDVGLDTDSGDPDDLITNDGTLLVSGQEAGATLTYSRNGGEFVSSFTAVEGENIVIVRSTDVAGNSEETEFTFTLDTGTVAPDVGLDTDSGDPDDLITNDGTLLVSGQEAGATLTYSRNGGEFVSSFTAVEGENSVIVRSTDVAGNIADTAFSFVLDTDADVGDNLRVEINDGDGYINNAEKAAVGFTVSGLDSDAKATVTFRDSANNTVVLADLGNGATNADLSDLLDGLITASISTVDTAGNAANGTGDTSTKDTSAPAAICIPLAVVENAPVLLPLVQDWLIDTVNQSNIQIGSIEYAWASGSVSNSLIDPVSKQPVALSTLGGTVTWSSDGKSLLIQTDGKLDWMTAGQQITATINYTVQDVAGNSTTMPIKLAIMGSSTDGKDKVLNGTNGVDKWTGADGTDYGQGGNGNDVLAGMAGNDALYGGNGNDDINGGTGTDYLYGDSGNDTIRGGDGNDVILGGMNNDTLYGNLGNDHFVFIGKSNNDKIMDFVKGTDTLHLIGLVPGDTTASEFVSTCVQDIGNDLLITVGDNTITLIGVADTSNLANSISFVMPQ